MRPVDRQLAETTGAPVGTGVVASYDRLKRAIAAYPSMIVAFSGGVDSALLAFVAHEALGESMLAVIASSPSLPGTEEEEAVDFLRTNGIPFERIATGEIDRVEYRRNGPDRCYHCKTELFSKLAELAEARGYATIAYGANTDDARDYRPGSKAALERAVVAPLSDTGLDKRGVRELARALGLRLWDKPSSPCLASRIPYFDEVTREKLIQIERAERVLRENGFTVCRVRHHGELARIEIPCGEHGRILGETMWMAVSEGIRAAGFYRVTLDPQGYRSGSLNETLHEDLRGR